MLAAGDVRKARALSLEKSAPVTANGKISVTAFVPVSNTSVLPPAVSATTTFTPSGETAITVPGTVVTWVGVALLVASRIMRPFELPRYALAPARSKIREFGELELGSVIDVGVDGFAGSIASRVVLAVTPSVSVGPVAYTVVVEVPTTDPLTRLL